MTPRNRDVIHRLIPRDRRSPPPDPSLSQVVVLAAGAPEILGTTDLTSRSRRPATRRGHSSWEARSRHAFRGTRPVSSGLPWPRPSGGRRPSTGREGRRPPSGGPIRPSNPLGHGRSGSLASPDRRSEFIRSDPLSPWRFAPKSSEKSCARKILCEVFSHCCRRGCDEAHPQNRRIAFKKLQNCGILLIEDLARRVGEAKWVEAGGAASEPAVHSRDEVRGPDSLTSGWPITRSGGELVPHATDALGGLVAGVGPVVRPAHGGKPCRSSAGISIAFGQNRARAIVCERETLQSKAWGLPRRYPLDPSVVAAMESGSSVPRRARGLWAGLAAVTDFAGEHPRRVRTKLPLSATGCHLATQSERPGAIRGPAANRTWWRPLGCRETGAEPAGPGVARPAPCTTRRNREVMHRPILTGLICETWLPASRAFPEIGANESRRSASNCLQDVLGRSNRTR
jgi:hypothetical protein